MSLTRVKNIGTLQSHFMCTRLLMGHVASARTPGVGEGRGQGPPYSHQLRGQVKSWWVWCGVGRSWLSSLHSEGMVGLLACQPGGFWQVPAGSGGGLLLGCAACLAESWRRRLGTPLTLLACSTTGLSLHVCKWIQSAFIWSALVLRRHRLRVWDTRIFLS